MGKSLTFFFFYFGLGFKISFLVTDHNCFPCRYPHSDSVRLSLLGAPTFYYRTKWNKKQHLSCSSWYLVPLHNSNNLLLFYLLKFFIFIYTFISTLTFYLDSHRRSHFCPTVSNKQQCIYQLITYQSLQPQVSPDFLNCCWFQERDFENVSPKII